LIDIKPKVITMDNRNDNSMSTGNTNSDDNTNETQSNSVNQEPTSTNTRKRPHQDVSQQDDVVIGVIGTQHKEPVAYQNISNKHKITVGDPAIQLEQSSSNNDDALIVTTCHNGNYSM
jgi:hypothetical protein